MPSAILIGMSAPLAPASYELALRWTNILTGIPVEDAQRARDELRAVGSAALESEMLGRHDVDSIVASYLLWEGLHELSQLVDGARLRKKLRSEPNVWSLFAELHVARLLLETLGEGTGVDLEPGGKATKQPDWRFTPVEGPSLEVEVKAVGMSDDEAAFCRRVAPALEQCLPRRGGSFHLHAPLDVSEIRLTREHRRHGAQEAARAAKKMPMAARQLSATIISARGAEDHYLRRINTRIAQAARQTSGATAWPALLWNNGAPVASISRAIDWQSMPGHIKGLAVVGTAVTFPIPLLHHFRMLLPRGVTDGSTDWWTEYPVETVAQIFDGIDRSSGVRAVLLGACRPSGRPLELLRRDGTRRVLPFNFYVEPDPVPVARQVDDR